MRRGQVAHVLYIIQEHKINKSKVVTLLIILRSKYRKKRLRKDMMLFMESFRVRVILTCTQLQVEECWEKKTPKQGTPGSKVEHQRVNPKTGEIEDSTVIYDEAGQQKYRKDKSDHGRS